MPRPRPHPTGIARTFDEHEIIVSKTDLQGRITYANHVFVRVSGYRENELMGQPHSIIRHPDMPRAVFKLLWDTIESRKEVFAYVNNMACNGDHYWVFAHVTPSFDRSGAVIGYHSNRRVPSPRAIEQITPLYRMLLDEERHHADKQAGTRGIVCPADADTGEQPAELRRIHLFAARRSGLVACHFWITSGRSVSRLR